MNENTQPKSALVIGAGPAGLTAAWVLGRQNVRVQVLEADTIVGGIAQQDGVFQYWVDGVLVMDRHNAYFRTGANPTMQFRTFLMGPWLSLGAATVDQYVWIDDLIVATAHP